MPDHTYSTSEQREVRLGGQFKGGGEGSLFDVAGEPDSVAKLYHSHHRTPEKQAKLFAMIAQPPHDAARDFTPPHTSIAWPTEILYDDANELAGFLMPRIRICPEVGEVFNPVSRAGLFPRFDWHYLHHTANNVARGLSAFHKRGHVMGDVNHKNILVAEDALVSFVDTDSYQIAGEEGRLMRCTVGTGEYTPRELQQKSFSTVDRAPYHDCFGLAVLIFQLLMEGYHPFDAVPLDPNVATKDGLLLNCINQGYFPYIRNRVVIPPPHAPRFGAIDPLLQNLFKRCFIDGHADPKARPTAMEWVEKLNIAEEDLLRCPKNPRHLNAPHWEGCQWCEREEQLAGKQAAPAQVATEGKSAPGGWKSWLGRLSTKKS